MGETLTLAESDGSEFLVGRIIVLFLVVGALEVSSNRTLFFWVGGDPGEPLADFSVDSEASFLTFSCVLRDIISER